MRGRPKQIEAHRATLTASLRQNAPPQSLADRNDLGQRKVTQALEANQMSCTRKASRPPSARCETWAIPKAFLVYPARRQVVWALQCMEGAIKALRSAVGAADGVRSPRLQNQSSAKPSKRPSVEAHDPAGTVRKLRGNRADLGDQPLVVVTGLGVDGALNNRHARGRARKLLRREARLPHTIEHESLPRADHGAGALEAHHEIGLVSHSVNFPIEPSFNGWNEGHGAPRPSLSPRD